MKLGLEKGSFALFEHDWVMLGAKGDPKGIYDDLKEVRYKESFRKYHTWEEHIIPGLLDMDTTLMHQTNARSRALSRMAWVCHDVIQKPKVSDVRNVAESAKYAEKVFKSARVDPAIVAEILDLILVTDHMRLPKNKTECLQIDTDLAIFGKDQETFDRYESHIELEYSWVTPKVEFLHKRLEIMSLFRNRGEYIYRLPEFKQKFGMQALINLDRSVKSLQLRLLST